MTGCPLSGRGQGHVSNFYILDLENFATASRRCTGVNFCQRRRPACGLHLRRLSASWLIVQVYYTLVYCKPLTPLLRFVLDSSYKLYLHCYAAVGKNSMTRRVARSVCFLLPTRRYASESTSYGPVSHSQVGVLSKRLNEPGWGFL